MKLYQIYFSPTGGTKKVTEVLAQTWQCQKEEIDLLKPTVQGEAYLFEKEDVCIIAVPSFGGRAPGVAIEKLAKMKGNGATAILTAVYGNREFEDTLVELQDTLEEAGFCCQAAVAAVAEHSIIHEFAAGRPDEADQEELRAFAKEIQRVLSKENAEREVQIPGDRPYREFGGVPMKPKAGKDCNQCGICAKECPVGAIPVDNPSETDTQKCISCMHCIAVCPKGARKNSKTLLFAAKQKMKKSCSGRKKNQLFV
jgi:ferredoxin